MKLIFNKFKLFVSRYESVLSDIALAMFPAVIVFLYIPLSLYLPNQQEFDNNIFVLIPFLYFLGFSLAVSLILLLMPEQLRKKIAAGLFFTGVFIALADMLTTSQLPGMSGFTLEGGSSSPLGAIIPETVVFFVMIGCFLKIPHHPVRQFGRVFIVFLVLIESLVCINALSANTHLGVSRPTLSPPPASTLANGNIYQIILDSYHRDLFPAIVQQQRLADRFENFVFFANNRANYLNTKPSTASFMTGTMYEQGRMSDWLAEKNRGGLIGNLADFGYEISIYTINNNWLHSRTSHSQTNQELLGEQGSYAMLFTFADLWLLRVWPDTLRLASLAPQKGMFQRVFGILGATNSDTLALRTVSSAMLLRQFMADEESRPDHGQYVLVHAYIPHPPFVFDANGTLVAKSSYAKQSIYATRLVTDFLTELKRLNRYDQSTIIIQSDHGWELKGVEPSAKELTLINDADLNIINEHGRLFSLIDNMSRALLLVKPPGKNHTPLTISDKPTQLADIPATIYDLLDIPLATKGTLPVFGSQFPENRQRNIYIGYMNVAENGSFKEFGVDFKHGELQHLTHSLTEGWQLHNSLQVDW